MQTAGARAASGAPTVRGSVLVALLQGAASLGLLALSSQPDQKIWQPPAAAGDRLTLSRVGALVAAGIATRARAAGAASAGTDRR